MSALRVVMLGVKVFIDLPRDNLALVLSFVLISGWMEGQSCHFYDGAEKP